MIGPSASVHAPPPTADRPVGAYRGDIDGLRAIAVLLVLVFHFDLFGLGQAGFIGVDIFFVISGYLISAIVWRDLSAGTFSLGTFYARRIRRLAPALVAVQLLLLVAAALFLVPSEVRDVARESMAAQLYVSNIFYWRTLNYFGLHADNAFMLHTWSLGVEEQFYLLFPIFMLGVHRWARRHLTMVLLALFAVSFLLNIALVGSKPEAVFYLLPTRAWELAAGALLWSVQPWFERHRSARDVAGPLALILIVATLVLHGPNIRFPGWFALLPVAGAALLLLAGVGTGSVVSKLLSLRPARFFGEISYPLYLVHWPIHVFGVTVAPTYTLGWRYAAFAASIILAALITHFVERPVRARTWLRSTRSLLWAYALALIAILLVCASALWSGGWSARLSPHARAVAAVADDTTPQDETAAGNQPLASIVRPIGAPGKAPEWLIYGDSHTGALADAFSLWLAGRGQAGELAFHTSCPPILDVGPPSCRTFNRDAIARAANRDVLLVSIWREPIDPGYRGRDGGVLTGQAALDDFDASVKRTVAALRAVGARIHVWEPLPVARFSVPQAMTRSLTWGNHWSVAMPLAGHRAQMGFVARAFDAAGVPARDRIDLAPAMCPRGTCPFVLDGLPVYSDNNHAARRSAPWFANAIERASSGGGAR